MKIIRCKWPALQRQLTDSSYVSWRPGTLELIFDDMGIRGCKLLDLVGHVVRQCRTWPLTAGCHQTTKRWGRRRPRPDGIGWLCRRARLMQMVTVARRMPMRHRLATTTSPTRTHPPGGRWTHRTACYRLYCSDLPIIIPTATRKKKKKPTTTPWARYPDGFNS